MALPFKINLGATDEPYSAFLFDADGVPDLAGASVRFVITPIGGTTPKIDASASIIGTPTNGQVSYTFVPTDVDTLGLYSVVWIVTFSDLVSRKYPSENQDIIEIVSGPNVGYKLQGACGPWTSTNQVRMTCSSLPVSGAPDYLSDEVVQSAINVATDLLFTLSGQQFPGECVTILRPCSPRNCYGRETQLSSWGFSGNVSDRSSWPPPTCGCGYVPSLDLGFWPVTNIVYTKIDGEIVDPSTYRLDQNRYLVRLDGAGPGFVNPGWPSCQYLARPSTETGTFEVIIEHGVQPPAAGSYAVARLACELLKALLGQPCHLPSRVSTVNRQQLSFTMINPSMLDNGLTGLYEVDMFIMAYNPAKQRGQTMVWSPDLDNRSYRAGT